MTRKPDSVEAGAALVVAALRPAVNSDWSARAGDLEWSVDRTIAHTTGAPAKYAFYLSSRSARYVAVRVWPEADATRQERLEAKLEDRSEIPLEVACDPATGEWRAIRWVT